MVAANPFSGRKIRICLLGMNSNVSLTPFDRTGIMSKKLKAIDLFCGAGGLTQGLKAAGYSVVGAVELDELAAKAYAMNHRKAHLWNEDIRTIRGAEILEKLALKRGELDLLAACPPCQGFSTMRTRNSGKTHTDPRNGLILEVLRLIQELKPKTVMLENVPGLSTYGKFKDFKDGLSAMGYKFKADILNTAKYGVPQRRKRLILLASLLAEPHFAEEAEGMATVAKAIRHLPAPSRSNDILHNYRVKKRTPRVEALIKEIPHDGGSRADLGAARQLDCHRKVDGFKDVYGRMAWNECSPTITGGCINPSKGRFLHPTANRAITLREAALLQTFPAKYRFPLNRGRFSVALLIGNALPPEFIRRHAKALAELSPE